MRRQDEFVAVSYVAIDEVIQQGPFQSCAHTGVNPVAGARQLDAPLVIDEAQILAQVYMVLGLKVKGVLFPNIAQGLVVFFAAGEQIGVGHVRQGKHTGGELVIQGLQLLLIFGDFLVDLHGGCHIRVDLGFQYGNILALLFRALLLTEELAVFLCQLILFGGLGFGVGLQRPDLDIQFQNAVNGSVAVHFLCLHARLDGIGVFLNSFDIDHDNFLS